MRVLLDEQLPRKLGSLLVGHEVSTVQAEGWAGLENGQLLRAAVERGFEVFVTKDQSLQYQQNLSQAGIGAVVLVAPSHDLEIVRPLTPAAIEAIDAVESGRFATSPGNSPQELTAGFASLTRAADQRPFRCAAGVDFAGLEGH